MIKQLNPTTYQSITTPFVSAHYHHFIHGAFQRSPSSKVLPPPKKEKQNKSSISIHLNIVTDYSTEVMAIF